MVAVAGIVRSKNEQHASGPPFGKRLHEFLEWPLDTEYPHGNDIGYISPVRLQWG
jgi:hypothetical protein